MEDADKPWKRGRVAPLAPLALAVGLGVVVDRVANPWETGAWGMVALGALASALVLGAARRWMGDRAASASMAVALAWACLGGAWHHGRWSDLAGDDLARSVEAEDWGPGERRVCWVRGVVIDESTFRPGDDGPNDRGSTRTVLALSAIHDDRVEGQWRPASGLVQAWIVGDRSDLVSGRSIEAAGVLSRVEGPLNPGEFDPRPMLRGRGIRLRLGIDGPSGVWDDPGGADWPWTRRLGAIRAWSFRRLASGLDPDTLPLAAALLLGRREAVDPEVNDAFARTGTTHLLAISGLQLQFLAVVMAVLARSSGLRRRPTFLIVALGTVGYAALVGLAPSVVRSAAMTVGACLAGWRNRCSTPGNLFSGAAFATIFLNPSDLFDYGCQLSFLAVAAIVWVVPAVLAWDAPKLLALDVVERQYEPWWRTRRRVGLAYLRAGIIGSSVVWAAAWPLVALRFHLVSPVAILANIPLIPLTSLALLLSGLTLAASAVWPPLGVPFAWGCGQSLRGTEAIVRWSTAWRWGHGFVPGPDPTWVGIFYALLAVATVALASRWPTPWVRRCWGASVASGFALAVSPLFPARPEVASAHVWAVGHGLSVAVRSPSGRTALYDAGKMGDPRIGRRVIAPALWSLGVERIDALILSHADADHFNGVGDLLDRFAIGSVRIPPGFADPKNPGAARLIAQVQARGIPIAPIAEGDVIDLGAGLTMKAIHPRPGDVSGTDNARSVVLEVAQNGRKLLLTGDLEHEGLFRLLGLAPPDPPVDAIVAPHHGGRTSNPPALYDWANPRVVAVSQRSPTAGSRDPLAFLEAPRERSPRLLRTWNTGAIRFRWTAEGLAATGFLEPTSTSSRTEGIALASMVRFPAFLAPGRPIPVGIALVGLVAGAGLALVVVAVEWGAWSLVAPGRRLVGSTPEIAAPEVPNSKRRITAQASDGSILVGDWFPSDQNQPSGRTIILLHGLAEDRRAFEVRVRRLVGAGWDVAAVDARGSGESGGRWVSFGGREADDLRAWLDALTELASAPTRFAAWGRSMGAATALRGAVDDARIQALILEAPYHDLRSTVAAVLRRMRVPGGLAGLILWRARMLAGVSLDRPRPIDLAPRVEAAALVVHGSLDPIADASQARRLAEAIGRDHGRTAEFLEVPGASHANVFAIGGDLLQDAVVAFLDRVIPRR